MPLSITTMPPLVRNEWIQRNMQSMQLKMENVLRDTVLDLASQLDMLDISFTQELMNRVNATDSNLAQIVNQNGALGNMSYQSPGLRAMNASIGQNDMFSPWNQHQPNAFNNGMFSSETRFDVHMSHSELLRQLLTCQGSEQKRRLILQDLISRLQSAYVRQFGAVSRQDMGIDPRIQRWEALMQDLRQSVLLLEELSFICQ